VSTSFPLMRLLQAAMFPVEQRVLQHFVQPQKRQQIIFMKRLLIQILLRKKKGKRMKMLGKKKKNILFI